jgi:hypothetical protein
MLGSYAACGGASTRRIESKEGAMTHRFRGVGIAVAVAATALLATALSACGTPSGSSLPTAVCDAAARFASTDPSRKAQRLDPVLRDCTSIDDLLAVAAKYGIGLAGDDVLSLARFRCSQVLAPRDGSLCPSILALPSSS